MHVTDPDPGGRPPDRAPLKGRAYLPLHVVPRQPSQSGRPLASALQSATELTVREHADVVSARVSGPLTPGAARRLFRAVALAMRRSGASRCMIDLRPAVLGLTVVDLYDTPALLADCGITRAGRIAVVAEADPRDYGFLETVCANNGYGLRLWPSTSSALGWLREGAFPARRPKAGPAGAREATGRRPSRTDGTALPAFGA